MVPNMFFTLSIHTKLDFLKSSWAELPENVHFCPRTATISELEPVKFRNAPKKQKLAV